MAFRHFRTVRLLILTALILTTGIATAPVRTTWDTLVARPVGQWMSQLRTAVTDVQPGRRQSARGGKDNLPLASLPPAGSVVSAPGQANLDRQLDDATASSGPSYGTAPGSDRNVTAPERISYLSGSGRTSGMEAASRSGSASLNVPMPSRASNSGRESVAGGRTRTGGGTRVGGGTTAGGGTAALPSGSRRGASREPVAGSAQGKGKGRFGEHKSGLKELTGSVTTKNPPLDQSAYSPTNVAVTPEPSTLLLLGTGIAAAAGAIRRRLR